MRVLYPLALLSLILSIIGAASAQDFSGLEQGIKPYGSYQGGDIDSISMVNGQLSLHIPLASYPQRGGKLRMGFSITYTNPYYQPWDNCMPPPSLCTSKNQAGYRLWYGAGGGLNAISIVPDFTVGAVAGYPPGQPPGPGQAPYDYSIIDYDGASHRMGQIANSFMSKDGTAYTLNTATAVITDPYGLRYTAQIINGVVGGFVTTTQDRNGNVITANLITNAAGSTLLQSWTDTVGRTIPSPPGMLGGSGGTPTTDFSGCTGTQPTTKAALWAPPGQNGGSTQYKICYASFPVSFFINPSNCQSLGICQSTTGTNSQMQSIVLPNGTAWTFEFDTSGALIKIGLPTGGSISHASIVNGICTGGGQPHLNLPPFGRSAISRTIDANDGSGPHAWNYSFGAYSTVTDPGGNDSVHHMTSFGSCSAVYETELDRYQGSQSGGTLLHKTVTAYSFTSDPYNTSAKMNIVPTSVTTTDVPSGKVTQVVKTYDSGVPMIGTGAGMNAIYGSIASQREYDFGSGSPQKLL